MSMEILAAGAGKMGLALSAVQLEQFETYYHELVGWNQRMNLTRITDYQEVQLKHFLDSLTVVAVWRDKPGVRFIDIGTGAGMPGIPLKLAHPDARAVLLEATAKKAVFLKHVIGKLRLTGIEVITGRAEEVAHDPSYRGRFDFVLARAVAALPALVEMALPFCAVGGRFVSQKKGDVQDEISRSLKAARLMGGRMLEVKPVAIPELPDGRCLVVYEKVADTPPQYPRRSGLPAAKPLL